MIKQVFIIKLVHNLLNLIIVLTVYVQLANDDVNKTTTI